ELIVCGCTPPEGVAHERLKVIPFLDKNDDKQRKELEQLLMSADFLLLPTRAEAYGLVFCEASAFGLPVIATNTGGVPEIVREGENGFLLPYEARGDAYAEVIARVYHNDERYAELVRASRAAFEERLNWDTMQRYFIAQGIPHQVIATFCIHPAEAAQISDLIARTRPRIILEVGTFIGMSTGVIALASANIPECRIVCVDPNFPVGPYI